MQNLKKSEKSRGILAFAYNVDTIDYQSIAEKTLKVASQKLQLPYTLVTDKEYSNNTENIRYSIDEQTFIKWRNVGRHHAFDISPYDETLVIDVDFLILENNLNKIFDCDWDYLLQRQSFALTKQWPKLMGPSSLPYIWATVFAFRKTKKSKLFFDLVGKIQRNYSYYYSLFNINERNFRNDYAFSIADIVLNGYNLESNSIPENMLAVDQVIDTIKLHNNNLIIKDSNRSYIVPKVNLHIMSKAYLQSKNFETFIHEISE